MTEADGILDSAVSFDPTDDFDAFLAKLPAKWAVYLLADADGRPVQLLCVKNLRASLRRRLGPPEPDAPRSKRVDYRDLVRSIAFRRVDSDFEADWLYFEAARVVFPGTYQGMVGFRPTWFIHVNPETRFPRYVKTIDLTTSTGVYVGPIEDKHAAAKLIQITEDAFDLCRYYHILIESPNAKACAYKEMGKCPAPCDGSITIDGYRQMIDWSLKTLIDPRPLLRDQEARMRAAAADLKFEVAARIKQHIDAVGQFGKGPFRHVRLLEDFRYLCLQHGPQAGTARAFVISPGEVELIACLIDPPEQASGLLRLIFEKGQHPIKRPLRREQIERIGVVGHHLFTAKHVHGVFLPLVDVHEKSLAKAYRELMKQKRPEETDAEGVTKELAAMEGPAII